MPLIIRISAPFPRSPRALTSQAGLIIQEIPAVTPHSEDEAARSRAATEAHLNALTCFLRQDEQFAVIIEDDAILSDSHQWMHFRSFDLFIPFRHNRAILPPDYRVVRGEVPSLGAFAYLCSRAFASALKVHLERGEVVDHALQRSLHSFRIGSYAGNVVSHDNSCISTICEKRRQHALRRAALVTVGCTSLFTPSLVSVSRELKRILEPALVISLPSRTDRRILLRSHWNHFPATQYSFFQAVRPDPASISCTTPPSTLPDSDPSRLLHMNQQIGTVGRLRSWRAALEQFLASHYPHMLITEDDCCWDSGTSSQIIEAHRELPEDWDALLFSSLETPTSYSPYSRHLRRIRKSPHLLAAVWSRTGAARLLILLQNDSDILETMLTRHADAMLLFCLASPCVSATPSFSDVRYCLPPLPEKSPLLQRLLRSGKKALKHLSTPTVSAKNRLIQGKKSAGHRMPE